MFELPSNYVSIVNRKPLPFLMLLALLAFCGQIIAAPFLPCPNELAQQQPAPKTDMHHDMGAHAMHMDHAMHHTDDGSMHTANTPVHFHDCDGFCSHCIGGVGAVVISSGDVGRIASEAPAVFPRMVFIPSPQLENLFKPPITALS